MKAARIPHPGRRAFTAVEVIVAVAVLALAVIPVLVSTQGSAKNVRLTEYHVIAQTRAKRILEAFSTFSLGELQDASGGGGELPPPFSEAELDSAALDLPEEYRAKMENFQERFRFEPMGEELGLVVVEITWTVSGRENTFRLTRMFAAQSLAETPAPPLGKSQ